jgi:transcriptional regulator with XRE-family HTH domain
MSLKDSFGLRLRAAREREGITLEDVADRTKVPLVLWEAMERNDFSSWPSGLFARAYVRDYARLVGLDAEEVVDEFCRYFPNGDRRRGRLIRHHAEVVDIRSQYRDEELPAGGDRRSPDTTAEVTAFPRFLPAKTGQRVLGALGDVVVVCAASVVASQVLRVGFLATLGVTSVAYYSIGFAIVGGSPGFALMQFLTRRVPQLINLAERRERRRMHA